MISKDTWKIDMVIRKTGCTKEKAIDYLDAEEWNEEDAIISLQGDDQGVMTKPFKYTEHMRTEIHGFDVTDATSEGTRPHDELVWVGFNTDGKWLTVKEATELANAILQTAEHNKTRREKK